MSVFYILIGFGKCVCADLRRQNMRIDKYAKALSGSLLDKQYKKCSTSVNEILNSETNLTLTV